MAEPIMNAQCMLSQDGLLLNLRNGLASEYRAKELCEVLLKFLSDPVDQQVIAKIVDDEIRHIKLTEQLISIVENEYTSQAV